MNLTLNQIRTLENKLNEKDLSRFRIMNSIIVGAYERNDYSMAAEYLQKCNEIIAPHEYM